MRFEQFLQKPLLVLISIIIFGLLASLPGLTTLPPLDRDETRFAQASTQMLESNDYITIRFQSEERNKKPGGIYWLQAISVSLFSNEHAREIWAYRLPSVLGAILAMVMTWRIGLILFDRQTAFIAAMMLGAAPSLMGEATIAKTDAMLLGVICISQLVLAKLYTDFYHQHTVKKLSSILWAILFWFALGGAVLLKGPIAPLIIFITIGGLMLSPLSPANSPPHKTLLNRVLTNASGLRHNLKPLMGLGILILCIAPWAFAISRATQGRFFSQALGNDLLGKVASVQESHFGMPGYHLLLLPVLLWPAAALLPLAAFTAFKHRHMPSIYFLLVWLVPSWIIFELTATKLPHYVLPLYPPIILLCAYTLKTVVQTSVSNTTANPDKRVLFLRAGALVYLTVGIIFALTLFILPNFFKTTSLGSGAILSAVFIFLFTFFNAYHYWKLNLKFANWGAIFSSFMTLAIALNITLPSLDKLHVSPAISKKLEVLARHPLNVQDNKNEPAPPIFIAGYSEPSIVFLLGTHTKLTNDLDEIIVALRTIPNQTVIIEEKFEKAFYALISQENLVVKDLGKVHGLNYSNGQNVTLKFFTLAS